MNTTADTDRRIIVRAMLAALALLGVVCAVMLVAPTARAAEEPDPTAPYFTTPGYCLTAEDVDALNDLAGAYHDAKLDSEIYLSSLLVAEHTVRAKDRYIAVQNGRIGFMWRQIDKKKATIAELRERIRELKS